MKPGKPLMAGTLGDAVVLGLPGNPVSAFVTASLFLLPLVARCCGAADPLPHGAPRQLAAPLPPPASAPNICAPAGATARVVPLAGAGQRGAARRCRGRLR